MCAGVSDELLVSLPGTQCGEGWVGGGFGGTEKGVLCFGSQREWVTRQISEWRVCVVLVGGKVSEKEKKKSRGWGGTGVGKRAMCGRKRKKKGGCVCGVVCGMGSDGFSFGRKELNAVQVWCVGGVWFVGEGDVGFGCGGWVD